MRGREGSISAGQPARLHPAPRPCPAGAAVRWRVGDCVHGREGRRERQRTPAAALVPADGRRRARRAAGARRPALPAARSRVPRADRDRVRRARLRRHAHPVRDGLRGRVAGHGLADPADAPREVPGRVPARAAVAHARGADGVDVPTSLRRPPAREHRDRRRARGARALRRVRGQGNALRAHRRVRRDHAGRVERRAVRLRG